MAGKIGPLWEGGGSPEAFKIDRGSRTGVLLIHGFTGSPAEMRGLGEYLAEQGYTVLGVRVPGHGTQATDLLRYTWRHWVGACGQALEELRRSCSCRQVFVAGLSNGGLLSLYVSATARPGVAGVICMSAPIYWTDWRLRALPLLKYAVRWHTKAEAQDADPAMRDRLWHYQRFPTAALANMNHLQRECRRVLPRLTAPLLVMHGMRDRTADPGCSKYIFQQAASEDKELVFWENSGHVITEDLERRAVWERALQFIAEHEGSGEQGAVGSGQAAGKVPVAAL